jgi:glycosyltransferase involved in cell wall biosynthesis
MSIPILFTIPNFITAGSGQVLVNIIAGLDKNIFAPVVCVEKNGGRLFQTLQEMQIPVLEHPFTVPIMPRYNLLYRVWKAAKVFRPYNFRLWHSFHYSDDYTEALIARFAGAKAWIYTKKNMGWGSRSWLLRSYLASRIAADNHDMIEGMFNRAGLRHKISYIPHGVDIQKFRPGLPARLGLRKSFNLPSGTSLIACVAELVPVKGHPILLDALARVPDVHLVLAGRPMDAEYADSLKKQAADLKLTDRVHFLGGVEDIPALVSECDLFILPTLGKGRMEGCPVALLEAMACGKPCIATNIPGSRDLILHEESGLLVPPEDPHALAAAINLLIHDPDLRMCYGAASRRRVEEHYTIEREAQQYEALYRRILKLT